MIDTFVDALFYVALMVFIVIDLIVYRVLREQMRGFEMRLKSLEDRFVDVQWLAVKAHAKVHHPEEFSRGQRTDPK